MAGRAVWCVERPPPCLGRQGWKLETCMGRLLFTRPSGPPVYPSIPETHYPAQVDYSYSQLNTWEGYTHFSISNTDRSVRGETQKNWKHTRLLN